VQPLCLRPADERCLLWKPLVPSSYEGIECSPLGVPNPERRHPALLALQEARPKTSICATPPLLTDVRAVWRPALNEIPDPSLQQETDYLFPPNCSDAGLLEGQPISHIQEVSKTDQTKAGERGILNVAQGLQSLRSRHAFSFTCWA